MLRTIINVGELGPGEERYPAAEIYPLREDPNAERLIRDGVAYFNAVDDPDVGPWFRRAPACGSARSPRSACRSWSRVRPGARSTRPPRPASRAFAERTCASSRPWPASWPWRSGGPSCSRACPGSPTRTRSPAWPTGARWRSASSARSSAPAGREATLAVLLCDVDELKAINDEAGHDAGDRALRRVAEALVAAAAARPGNLVGRLAGDEFCVVMEGAGLDDARALAAAALADLVEGNGQGHLMISCGAAALGRGVRPPAELLRAADAALYRAKRNGGGQIFTAGSRGAEDAAHRERAHDAAHAACSERMRDAVQELTGRFDERPGRRGPARANRGGGRGALGSAERRRLGDLVRPGRRRHDPHGVPGRRARPATRGTAPEARQRRLPGRRVPRHRAAAARPEPAPSSRASTTRKRTARSATSSPRSGATSVLDRGGGRPRRHLAARAVRRPAAAWRSRRASLEAGLLVRAAIPPRPAGKGGAALLERRTRQLGADQRAGCAVGDERATAPR